MSCRLDGRSLLVITGADKNRRGPKKMTGCLVNGQIQRTTAHACQLILWVASAADEADCLVD